MRATRHRRRSIPVLAALAAATVAAPVLLAATPAAAHPREGGLAKELVEEVTAQGAYRHLKKFQQIADANGGNRAAGTPGHAASAAYVYDTLKKAGYQVSYQDFDIYEARTRTERTTVLGPGSRELTTAAFTFTLHAGRRADRAARPGQGRRDPRLHRRRLSGRSLRREDRPGQAGYVHLRGEAAGRGRGRRARRDRLQPQRHRPGTRHVRLARRGDHPERRDHAGRRRGAGRGRRRGEVSVRLELDQEHVRKTTRNVIAETRGGRSDRVVTVGAHLDSVAEGPGINDNGSGSAGLLEVALKLAEEGANKKGKGPANKVRFGWWSAEELGLLGSEHYVAQLSEKQKKDIALYLNFDMIASPNPVQFVYDGDDSDRTGAGAGPAGSDRIEALINGFLDKKGKPHEGSDFDGRSDYGPFIANGIPAGGTFTGAEGVKTAEQAARHGGTAGAPYDPNYHGAGDTLKNVDLKVFDTNLDVIAYAVGTYAGSLRSLGKP